jgi:hypothetical protein
MIIGIAAALVVVAAVGWKVLHHPPPPPPAPAVTTATVMIRYASDRHKCTPDLNVTIAGKAFHPTSNAFAASGVKSGAQEYTIDGSISCPGRKAVQASGSGAIDVHEGAVFDLAWQAKSGGTSNVDLIRVTDDSAPPVANHEKGGHGSQNPVQNNVPRTVTPAPTPVPVPLPVQAVAGQQQLQNAQAAYAQGRYFAPLNSSALFWAIQSRNAGNQNARALELQIDNIYKAQVTQLYQQRNYPAAMQLVDLMLSYYPGEAGLLRDKQMIMAAANGGAKQAPFNVQMPRPQYPPGAMPPRPVPHP